MFENPISCELASMCHQTRRGMYPDLNDQKKTKGESQRDVLTSKDLVMLELTSAELERIILNPINERFMGGRADGFGNDSFQHRQQQQPGRVTIPRDEQDPQRSFNSSMNQLRHQQNLPEPALEAALASDEEYSDTGSCLSAFVPNPPTQIGFTSKSYFNMDRKQTSQQAKTSLTPSIIGSTSARMGTILTAVDPGVSYLPSGAFNSVISRLKEEPMQLVPCLDGSPVSGFLPPMSPIDMDEQDRVKQERKRERNRLAARKCRTKKLEQIMVLEGHVRELKEQNRALGDTATGLRALMLQLQSQISQHINCGCPMMMPDSSLSPSSSSFAVQ